MPRKYRRDLAHRFADHAASMRPGRMPRKYPDEALVVALVTEWASMRPGRMPRKYPGHADREPEANHASMRPGRMPRKYPGHRTSLRLLGARFNEAGADAPEIPRTFPES